MTKIAFTQRADGIRRPFRVYSTSVGAGAGTAAGAGGPG
jgi:hypothetical protein